jgi:sodium/potassium-transporting ATPase subunit alpha
VANVFACRSDRASLSQLGWFTNPLLLWGIATELAVLAFIIYTPWGNAIFGTSPLPVWIFGPLALGALALLLSEESRKFIANRFNNRRTDGVTQQAGTS